MGIDGCTTTIESSGLDGQEQMSACRCTNATLIEVGGGLQVRPQHHCGIRATTDGVHEPVGVEDGHFCFVDSNSGSDRNTPRGVQEDP